MTTSAHCAWLPALAVGWLPGVAVGWLPGVAGGWLVRRPVRGRSVARPAGSRLAGSGLGHLECVPAQREVGRHHRGEAITRNTHCLVRPADHHLDGRDARPSSNTICTRGRAPGLALDGPPRRRLAGRTTTAGRSVRCNGAGFHSRRETVTSSSATAGDTQRGEDSNQRCRADRLLNAVPTAEVGATPCPRRCSAVNSAMDPIYGNYPGLSETSDHRGLGLPGSLLTPAGLHALAAGARLVDRRMLAPAVVLGIQGKTQRGSTIFGGCAGGSK